VETKARLQYEFPSTQPTNHSTKMILIYYQLTNGIINRQLVHQLFQPSNHRTIQIKIIAGKLSEKETHHMQPPIPNPTNYGTNTN